MKFSISMAILCGLFSASLPLAVPHTPVEVDNNLVAYINIPHKSIPIPLQDSPCFKAFYPIFNSSEDQAKDQAEICHKTAFSKLKSVMQVENEKFKETVEKIKNPLKTCGSGNDLEYFQCMTDIADEVDAYFKQIEKMYAELLKTHSVEMKKINNEQLICLEEVIENLKCENDEIYGNLKKCTMNDQWTTTPFPNINENGDQKREEYTNNKNTPIVIGVAIVVLGIVFCVIFLGAVLYKTKRIHREVMD